MTIKIKYFKKSLIGLLIGVFLLSTSYVVNETKEPEVKITQIYYDGFSTHVKGTVKANSNTYDDFIFINISIYDENGYKVGTAYDECSGIKKGETWGFDALYIGDYPYAKVDEVNGI
jgi:hypothetical protein